MRLMISVVSAAEARQAINGGADLLDVKNPAEGSLGAQFPGVIREIKNAALGKVETSAAIGDMPNLPGTAALAALGAAHCGVEYIKVGLRGSRNPAEALKLLCAIQEAVREFNSLVIAAAYADHQRIGALAPCYLPDLAASAGIKGCLIDTGVKDGHTLFDFVKPAELQMLADQAHGAGLLFGAAGALRRQDLSLLQDAEVDVAGLRTAACRDANREGPLDPARIRDLVDAVYGRTRARVHA
jgi:uncharacterized protein (UPF0264 family)